jgi:hypothetical protein
MVWQLVVLPGTHTVTDVNSVLTLALEGPGSMMTLATLPVPAPLLLLEPPLLLLLPPLLPPLLLPPPLLLTPTPRPLPPEQAIADRHSTAQSPIRSECIKAISANLRR